MMQTEIGKDESDWVSLAWTWVNDNVGPGSSVYVPAGNTPRPLYQRWVSEPTKLLQSLKLLQIDDVLTGPKQGLFRQFFKTELPSFVGQFEWIDQADQVADIAILGVGLNGHVAFHEPGVDRQFFSGCIPLSNQTRVSLKLEEETWGVTYGVAAFLRCKKILVLARGPEKKAILSRAKTDQSLPIAWILQHPEVTVITD